MEEYFRIYFAYIFADSYWLGRIYRDQLGPLKSSYYIHCLFSLYATHAKVDSELEKKSNLSGTLRIRNVAACWARIWVKMKQETSLNPFKGRRKNEELE